MIKFLLKCENKHEFESWFSDSKEFEKLKKKNFIECIFCKTVKISKSIMSPNIVGKKTKKNIIVNNKEFFEIKKDLQKIKNFVEKNFEFVGDKFPKEVIYGDITKKPLCQPGEADNIFCSHTLEHMAFEEMKTALSNIYTMLKPGGCFRLIVPSLETKVKKCEDFLF